MRCSIFVSLAFAALSLAQTLNNAINIAAGQSTLNVVAGQPTTITWQNPSSGTVTIKLQQGNTTPDSGFVLASGIPASAETATFTIPVTANSNYYVIEIIDDTNPNNINFSPRFVISGATGTQTGIFPGSTDSSSASATSGSSASTSGSSASTTGSTTSSASSSSASGSSSSGSSSSRTSFSFASRTSAASSASQTTTAPTSNAAMPLKIQGGLIAVVMGGVALL